MKKLLQWFAPIPFVVIAFGWGHSTGSAGNPEDTSTYFYGTGVEGNANVARGAQNDRYNVIAIDINKVSDTEIRYEINETVDYTHIIGSTPITTSAFAKPEWTPGANSSTVGAFLGSDIDTYSSVKLDHNGDPLVDNAYYTNTGEDLLHVHDAVEIDFNRYDDKLIGEDGKETEFVLKSSLNTSAEWEIDKSNMQKFLMDNFGDCATVTALDNIEFRQIATGDLSQAGTSLEKEGLYLAAALRTAEAACK